MSTRYGREAYWRLAELVFLIGNGPPVLYADDMGESDAASTQADLKALEALQADAPDLERIETFLNQFNVFETIGFTGQELMHSRFLAFLLDPKQTHGLGDLFLKSFLQKVLESTNKVSLRQAFDNADEGDLDQTTVHTEVYTGDGRIDFLLLNAARKWAMIIENKVFSTEHSDQLGKYYRFVKASHSDWHIVGCYLTPGGDAPSHVAYSSLSFRAVCEIVDSILEDRNERLNSDVRMSMEHYVQMVRRHIVDDPEVVELCGYMYRKHKKALDLIYKHRPDPKVETRDLLVEMIHNAEALVFKGAYKNDYITFRPQGWEEVPAFNAGDSAHGFLRFVFQNNQPDRLDLVLETSRGDEKIRRKLYEMGQKDESLFNDLEDPETDEKPKLYRRTFVTPEFYKDASDTARVQELRRQWDEFLDKDLPRIETALKEETWIWESVQPDEEQSSQGSRFVWEDGDIVITKRPVDED